MTNAEFLIFCYNKILRRAPDPPGIDFHLNALDSAAYTREQVLLAFLNSDEYRQQRDSESLKSEPFPPGHFYSALPSEQDRREALARSYAVTELPAIDLALPDQITFLESLKPFLTDCLLPEKPSTDFRYFFLNGSYSFGDGLILQAMIRKLRPRRIVEIGSGYTSALMLDVNDRYLGGHIDFTFIDPYADQLRSLMWPQDHRHTLLENRLQDADSTVFTALQSNDILFVDSTHVSKLGSDVNRIVFDILPTLNRGVHVHIHDVFWPFEYPHPWIREGRAWNEAYILRAFLQFNYAYEIVFFSDLAVKKLSPWFQANIPLLFRNTGGNIWLRRKA